jgi:hypothetical protein
MGGWLPMALICLEIAYWLPLGQMIARFLPVRIVGHRFWISVVFFLMVAAPGFWLPVLSNVLAQRGWESVTAWAFVIPPVAMIVSPLLFASLADHRYPAERVLAVTLGGGAIFLYAAFWAVERFDSPLPFLCFFALNCLVSAPAFSVLTGLTFQHLAGGRGANFGSYRVWGTVGWICAGILVSVFKLDLSPKAGVIASGVRVAAGACCLFLPHTPPSGKSFGGWREALGFRAFRLLLNRDMGVYFFTAFLFSIPLTAFYLHTPRHLEAVGWERVGAGMALGQITEVIALFALAKILSRWRIKTVFMVAIGCGVVRYSLNMVAGLTGSVEWLLAGIVLHGVCWTLFFESGRVFVDRRVGSENRSQAQALLTFAQGGLGGVFGTVVVALLYRGTILAGVENAWVWYWGVLTVMCLVCGVLFKVGYKGAAFGQSDQSFSDAMRRVK